MDASDPAASASPALDYAPRPSARRRWGRRLLRWWPAWVLLVLGGLGVAYGPGAWRHYKLMRLQEACMAAELPADRPAFENDPDVGRALVTAWPTGFRRLPDLWTVRTDPRWAAMAAELGASPSPFGTSFCHERFTPDGRRRLIVLEDRVFATVVEPGGWVGAREPRVVRSAAVDSADPEMDRTLREARDLGGVWRTAVGIPDPADRSRWTVAIVENGIPGTLEYRLHDDERVTMRLLDPDGFRARAEAHRSAIRAAMKTLPIPSPGSDESITGPAGR